jgi:two-component system, OmpR family, phosphate regulon response regulator OmpR
MLAEATTISAKPRVLIVDDDDRLSSMVTEYLRSHRIDVDQALDCRTGYSRLDGSRFDLLILDLMLPDGDGLEFCKQLRARKDGMAQLPVLMLTAKGEAMDRVIGLELGADDYLGKPFEPRELLARIRALLRRPALPSSNGAILQFGRLAIDLDARKVRIETRECALTAHQFDTLVALAERPGQVLSREQLMDRTRGTALEAFDRSIDVHIARIRAEIEDDPKTPQRIHTVRGVGYVFAKAQT